MRELPKNITEELDKAFDLISDARVSDDNYDNGCDAIERIVARYLNYKYYGQGGDERCIAAIRRVAKTWAKVWEKWRLQTTSLKQPFMKTSASQIYSSSKTTIQ